MFAEDDSNWVELDNLLAKLVRPLKRRTCDDFDED